MKERDAGQVTEEDNKSRVFVIFITRVMFLRLKPQQIQSTFSKIWPHLLNELIAIFENRDDIDSNQKRTVDLTSEAIKLIQLLSSLNIEDF